MLLALAIFGVLFLIAAFGPLRWSIVAYLLLSTIDFSQSSESIGMLNTAKGIILPLYLLWRLRAYGGHRKIILAPIAWSLLVVYVAIAGFWSAFPIAALKLIGHMTGSLLICFLLIRATKAGLLNMRIAVPLAIGTLALGIICSAAESHWAGNEGRFSSFCTAQAYASFLAALYCIVLCSRTLPMFVRIATVATLAAALVLNGSRIWTIGIVIATFVALFVSEVRPCVKIWSGGLTIVLVAVVLGSAEAAIAVIAPYAESNRIAAAIIAAYQGDTRSDGLGTYRFRRGADAKELAGIEESSPFQLLFGHGTSNGSLLVVGNRIKPGMDPNRLMHNEWLRVMYEWGILGAALWVMFIGSIAIYALDGLKGESGDYAKPLVAYLPAFLLGLAGENILAGAGSSASVGFLLLVALASVSHRQFTSPTFRRVAGAEPLMVPLFASHT
jgi:O-antigen ligase